MSKKYINRSHPLIWKCAKGHRWEEKPTTTLRTSWCPYCNRRRTRTKTLSEIKQMAADKGGRCLSQSYKNSRQKLLWECSEGHQWWAVQGDIYTGHWCPECYGNVLGSIDDMRQIAVDRGGRCISRKYVNRNSKLTWECSEGHRWDATPGKISQGHWCPTCQGSIGEAHCRCLLEAIFDAEFPKKRPAWLLSQEGTRMELDGYCEKIGLAFEYQGEQHFETHKMFHQSKSDLESQVRRDERKQRLCTEHTVKLLTIPYDIPQDRLPRFMVKTCRDMGMRVPQGWQKRSTSIHGGYSRRMLVELREIARNRGGELLSTVYTGTHGKLTWRCSKGHEWRAKAYKIKDSNRWCRVCAGNVRKTMVDMERLAKKRGGLCLSKRYVNAHTPLLWQCAEGHIWKAKPNSIQQGKWCRVCGYRKAKRG